MPYPATKCFMIVSTNRVRRALRRYERSDSPCPHNEGQYHNVEVPLDEVHESVEHEGEPPRTDPRWPTRCSCGHQFSASAPFQLFNNHIYRREDNGEEMTLRDAPPGAIYNAEWLSDIPEYTGPDGQSLICVLPNGRPWQIDCRASNCTMPDDKVHKCWVRHGTPPMLTVDKNGNTCAAGAGSIQSGDYHGFLQNGVLTAG